MSQRARLRPATRGTRRVPVGALRPSVGAVDVTSLRRIAVLRALQLGDMLCAVPALRALRAAAPHAAITLIGLPWARAFVERFERYLDAFLEFPGYPGLPERTPDLQAFPVFLEHAHQAGFDLVIQMHGSGEITNPLSVLLGGAARAGFYRRGHYCPDHSRFIEYPDSEPELRRHLALVQFLGAAPRGEFLEFPVTDDDRASARRAAGDHLGRGQYVCVHPGARAAERRWSPAAFAHLGDLLARRGFTVVLTGSEDEAPLTRQVAAGMRASAIDASGCTSLGGLAALIAGARLLVCNDTGVSHIADALSVPSVVIFTASDPRRWAPLHRSAHRVVTAPGVADRGEYEGTDARHVSRSMLERAVAEVDHLLGGEGTYAA